MKPQSLKEHVSGQSRYPPENTIIPQIDGAGSVDSDSDESTNDISSNNSYIYGDNYSVSQYSLNYYENYTNERNSYNNLHRQDSGANVSFISNRRRNPNDNNGNNNNDGYSDEDYLLSTILLMSDDESIEEEEDSICSKSCVNINIPKIEDNNLLFNYTKIGIGKTYISGASGYPPELDSSITVGAFESEFGQFNNRIYDGNFVINEITSQQILESHTITEIHTEDPVGIYESGNLISNTTFEIEENKADLSASVCTINGVINEYEIPFEEELHEFIKKDDIVIHNKTRQWYINVPITTEDGSVIKLQIFADPGACVGCVKTEWAIKHFYSFIRKNRRHQVLYTPSGSYRPKYVLWLSFPTKSGKILKARMYLTDHLPVDVLADINMLTAFGYHFKDETPEAFIEHKANEDIDFELDNHGEKQEEVDTPQNQWFESFKKEKLDYVNLVGTRDDTPPVYNKVLVNNVLIKDNDITPEPTLPMVGAIATKDCETPDETGVDPKPEIERYKCKGVIDVNNVIFTGITQITHYKNYEMRAQVEAIANYYDVLNKEKPYSPYHYCLFINARQLYLASKDEIDAAHKIHQNFELKPNDITYLKTYEKIFGPRYTGLYEAVRDLIEEYREIWATHTFTRFTMNVPVTYLGIKPEHRSKTMYAQQYPINYAKRLSMINYTEENEKNGFWYKIEKALHCIPYTMVPKKRNGVIYRYRPAFDGRVVNQYCYLMDTNMPTLRDIRDLHSIGGLTTIADIKNCFDCIPLAEIDRKYANALTPLGLYQMTCQTYGWKNAAPNAQNITNDLCLHTGLTLAYIDDITMKHPTDYGTREIVKHLRRLFQYCKDKVIKLDPTKFYPCITDADGFSFRWGLQGTTVAESYRNKVLAIAKPTRWTEMEHFLGVIGYITNHIYHAAFMTYWLRILKDNCGKKGIIHWTPQADLAYKQIMYCVKHSPLLYHPTKEGKYAIKTDACNYGVGAVLYQWQTPHGEEKPRWVIIDMWSKVMPKQLRHSHSMVHEAYAIVGACDYWQFHLLRRKFIIASDNNPVANIFNKEKFRTLSPITQRQILRLRVIIEIFSFATYHIAGIENQLADSLSRYTSELYALPNTDNIITAVDSNDTSNPQLTDEQYRELDEYFALCEKQRGKHQELVKGPLVATLSSQLTFSHNKHESIFQARQRHWNDLMYRYHRSASYFNRKQVKDFLGCVTDMLVMDDQYAFNDNSFQVFRGEVGAIADCANELSNATVNTIAKLADDILTPKAEDIKQESKEEVIVATTKQDRYETSRYEPNEEISNSGTGVSTRSKRKYNVKNIDDIIDIEFKDTRLQSDTRDDIIRAVFGYRDELDIFEDESFVLHQRNDIATRTAITLLRKNGTVTDDELAVLYKLDVYLCSALRHGHLRLNTKGILECRCYNSQRGKEQWNYQVPFNIRGKLISYHHHNLQLHHLGYLHTMDSIERKYWWGTMKRDVRRHCKTCITCQYTKGSVRHRAPLRIRKLPKRKEHLFADFLGPIYGKYYILVLVDYATGYTLLIPTVGCDGITVVNSIFDKWVPLFGWFNVFETDWGSGFNNQLINALTAKLNIKHHLAEPRNHRSIGKVERVIQMVQQTLQIYNVQFGATLTDRMDKQEENWNTVKLLLPLIQSGINQRRPRFTTYSPNMLMFGENVKDISELGDLSEELHTLIEDSNNQIDNQDYKRLFKLNEHIKRISKIFTEDWKKYTFISTKSYSTKWNITPTSITAYKKRFRVGQNVLYYIGDRQTARNKWRQKWTGPWVIDKVLNDSTLIIADKETGNQKRVSFDRIKLFNLVELEPYQDVFGDDKDYVDHWGELKRDYSNYSTAQTQKPDENLDYTRS